MINTPVLRRDVILSTVLKPHEFSEKFADSRRMLCVQFPRFIVTLTTPLVRVTSVNPAFTSKELAVVGCYFTY